MNRINYVALFILYTTSGYIKSAAHPITEEHGFYNPYSNVRLEVTHGSKKREYLLICDDIVLASKLSLQENTLSLEDELPCSAISSIMIKGIPSQPTLLSLICSGRYPLETDETGKFVPNKYPMQYIFYSTASAHAIKKLIKHTQGMKSIAAVIHYMQDTAFKHPTAVIDLERILHAFHGGDWKNVLPWRAAPYLEDGTVRLDTCTYAKQGGIHHKNIHGLLEKALQEQKKRCILQ